MSCVRNIKQIEWGARWVRPVGIPLAFAGSSTSR
uniref:Uncharacterized protein n=1 Tax=Arundo donax TaxID=35708 RepID=A0A0A9AFG7_ARUDO